MAAPATYLYGDSTPSTLKIDFIAFLRDAFDLSVQLLLCESHLLDTARRVAHLSESTERDVASAESFAAEVAIALDRIASAHPDALATRCVGGARQCVADLVRTECEAARGVVAVERELAAQSAATEHEACRRAFEGFALRHTLPEAEIAARVALESNGAYSARLRCATPYGIEWALALAIPGEHAFARPLRLERVVERLEISAPEESGWLHKEIKLRPQRFDRLYLKELTNDAAGATLKLRAGQDGSGAGFDLSFKHKTGTVQLRRVLEEGTVEDTVYDVVGDDLAKLHSLRERLLAITADVSERREALVEASVDGVPLHQVESPRMIVDRLLAHIAPTVHEIARRSLAPGELVLKRLVRDNQREEVFVSKAELERKLDILPPALRQAFDLLALWGDTAAPSGELPAPSGDLPWSSDEGHAAADEVPSSLPAARPKSMPPAEAKPAP
jgi:hypothetical protein